MKQGEINAVTHCLFVKQNLNLVKLIKELPFVDEKTIHSERFADKIILLCSGNENARSTR